MNYQDRNGKTALIAAAEGGHQQLVSELINFGVNVNLKKQNGISALHLESQNGHLQNVQALLQKGAEINGLAVYKFKKDYTPLILASANGNLEVVNYLLDQGANIRAKTDQGVNSFSMAAEKGHLQIVKALYRKDSSILEQKVRW
jgi:ankyrin repeat protein